MVVRFDERSATLDLGGGYSLTISECAMDDAPPDLHLEISHKNDQYLRVGKAISGRDLRKLLDELLPVKHSTPECDWALIDVRAAITTNHAEQESRS